MNAKKCDRCGKFYVPQLKKEDLVLSLEKVVRKEKHITDICDLCPDCVSAFYDWLRSAEVKGGKQG